VTTTPSAPLRLYIENDSAGCAPSPISPSLLDRICKTYAAATGWPLVHFAPGDTIPHLNQWTHKLAGPDREKTATLALVPSAIGSNADSDEGDRSNPVTTELATDLAQSIAALLDELYKTRTTLWQREAHLASAIPLVVRPEDEDRQLAERLESVLRCGAESVGCQAAALYLLDDDTRFLKLRSHWGLSDECFLDEPRRLRGSKGDLEALTGHAVVLEQPDRCEAWDTPHTSATAICVPVATATVPLGTFWIFGSEPRRFSDAEVNLIEVVAGRLAVELEREILLREQALACRDRDAIDATIWQQSQWKPALPKLDAWKFAAAPSDSESLHGDFLGSHVHEDQRVGLTLASAEGTGVVAALAAAAFAATAQSHRTMLQPARRLARMNETMSALSSGDQTLSTFCGLLDPENGQLQLATAGTAQVFAIRPHGWEELTADVGGQFVGAASDSSYRLIKTQLDPSDVLFVVTGRRRSTRTSSIPRADARQLAEALLHHHHLSAQQMVEYITALVTREATIWYDRPAVLIIGRDD
jgi:sigma-B regulation protein RsbU (phosphoserine phosphatase)